MDWGQIIVMVLAGTAGAIAGAMIGLLLGPVFGLLGDRFRGFAKFLAFVLGAVAGVLHLSAFIEPHAAPLIARYAPSMQGEGPAARAGERPQEAKIITTLDEEPVRDAAISAAIDEAMIDLGDPFFEAVLEREPGRSEGLNSRLTAAYKRGGQDELVRELIRADQDIIQLAFPFYMARAQEEDLLVAVSAFREVIMALSVKDPETCHLWLYGASVGRPFDYGRYLAAIGEEKHLYLQSRLADVVRNAEEFLPDYDAEYADFALQQIKSELTATLGAEKVGLVLSGQEPENLADSKLACDASAQFYDAILRDDKAIDILRHRYLTSI